MLNKLVDLYFYCVLKKPLVTVLCISAFVIFFASQLPNVKIDASSDSLTLEYDKDLDYFREISKRYQSGDFLVVTYKPHADLFADETLEHLRALQEELLTVGGIDSANSILNVPLLYSPPITLTEVTKGVKTLSEDGVSYDLAKKEFQQSPIYRDMLLGPDGKTTAILLNLAIDNRFIELVRERDALRLKRDTDGLTTEEQQRLKSVSETFLEYRTQAAEESRQRVEKVREVVSRYKDNADIFLGGVTMITADMVEFIGNDIVVFGTGIVLFIIAMLSFIFRRWQFVVLPLATCLVTLITMLGFLGSIDWRLTVISSNFVALLLIVCLMITIHLIVRYREYAQRHNNADVAEDLRDTLTVMYRPCLYTVLTTIVAFVSLVVSGIRPVIDFGWMMTIGLSVSFFMAFTLIPAGLMLLPKVNINFTKDNSHVFTLMFSRFTERRGKLIVILGIVATIVSVIGMSQLKVENRFIDYFHSSTEIHQGMLVIDQQLGGTISLDIVINHQNHVGSVASINITSDEFSDNGNSGNDPFAPVKNNSDEFSDDEFGESDDPFATKNSVVDGQTDSQSPAINSYWFTQLGMERIEAVHDYLNELSEVGKVQSLATLYKVTRDLNGDKNLNDFELALVGQALPQDIRSFLIDPYLAPSIDQTRITMRIKETDPDLRRAELLKTIRNHLIDNLGFQSEQVHLTGVLVLYNNMLQSLFKSQILTLGAVFVGIMLMFLVLFRSVKLSLIALTPNVLAALVVLGGMGLVGVPLDMMTITIAAIAIGIGVDDAVHYIYRYREEFKQDRNYINTMHRAHGSIGLAMYYTSVTVIVGFSVLALSEFIPSIYFGLLTGLAMLAAIVASLTLLPKLILITKPLGPEGD